MIRLSSRLIGHSLSRPISQNSIRSNSLCLLISSDCITQQSSIDASSLDGKLPFSKFFSSLSTPVIETNTVPDLSTNPQENSIIETMQQFGFSVNEVKTLLNKEQSLLKTSSNLWSDIVAALLEFGLYNDCILTILENWPKILFIKKKDLEKRLMAWQDCGFGQDLLFLVLTTQPSLLQIDHNVVLKRVKQFQKYFESKTRPAKMLLLAPNALDENWSSLLEKLNYLDELCTGKSSIVSSGVLAHSVFHIKVRHEFLIRAGIYKRPQKDFNQRLSKNPKLENIVNMSDEQYVANVAKLSMFEFVVFLDMFKEEIENNESEDNSDSDDDTLNNSYKKQNSRNK